MLVKVDENANPVKNHFLTNPNILLHHVIFFHQIFVSVRYIINISSIIINVKIINITIESSLIILSTVYSFEMFPKHNIAATISESFALNL